MMSKVNNKEIVQKEIKKFIFNKDQINSLNSVIKFIINLTTNYIRIDTIVDKAFRPLERKYLEESRNDLYYKLTSHLFDSEVYSKGRKIYESKIKLEHIRGSEAQEKLIECTTVVQELQDTAQGKQMLNSVKRYFLITLKGALDELLYMIDPISDQMKLKSKDTTHLRKTAMAVYMNASKLISLETLVLGKDPQKSFMEQLKKLPQEKLEDILKNYLISEFKASWLPYLPDNLQQSSLETLVMTPDLNVQITPTILLHLFQNYRKQERLSFLKLLSGELDGTELKYLKEIKIDGN